MIGPNNQGQVTQYEVGRLCVCPRDGRPLLAPRTSYQRHVSAIKPSLQLVRRFTAVEQRADLAPEGREVK